MAKENTHAKFAKDLIGTKGFPSLLKKIVQDNRLVYLYGSVFPDSFYYAFDKEIEKISVDLHKNIIPVNEIPIELLKTKDLKNIALALGYITHCCLDIEFHKTINGICGDDEYKHLQIETSYDKKYCGKWRFFTIKNIFSLRKFFPFDPLLKIGFLKRVNIYGTFLTESIFNRIFRFKPLYKIYNLLSKSHKRALFYGVDNIDINLDGEVERAAKNVLEIFRKIELFLEEKLEEKEALEAVPSMAID